MNPRSLVALVAAGIVVIACSDAPPAANAPVQQPTDAGIEDAPAIDAPPPLPPPAPFTIEEEAASPCEITATATARAVTTDGSVLADLTPAGNRFVARLLSGAGFIAFDRDGQNASAPASVGTDVRFAASSTKIVAAGVDGTSGMLAVRSFDLATMPTGAPQTLGPLRAGRAFAVAQGARNPESSIVVWVAPPYELRARVLDASGGPSAPIRLEEGADFDDLSIVAAPSPSSTDASEFLVVWSLRRLALSAYRVYAALVGPSGVIGLPRIVFGSDVRVSVASLVARGGEGATLLANREGDPLLVPLDVLGRPSAPARLFRGAREPSVGGGQGLAAGHDRIAFVAAHESGAHALRLTGVDGKPQGGWICLDAPSPDAFQLGSVVADDVGWTVLVASAQGSSVIALDPSAKNPR